MSESERWNPSLHEDLQLRLREGGPVDYTYRTDKPVQYVAVANDSIGILGYLWACDADDAAGWVARPAAGHEGVNSAIIWFHDLREAKARGLEPSRALAEFAALPKGTYVDWVVPGSWASADSVAALEELASEGYTPPPPRPRPVRRREP
ncbi:hypothetical protein [Kitasatospora azatica]|uniref:hypothetical protein n=1 Tax=Kitasatospora azatica TaxID=58347 RepID=UPI00068AD25D|nr:hypothetical protein [Kitasatospora azatica]